MVDKRYNKNLKKYIFLNKGENFCIKCRGNGLVKSKPVNFRKALILKCDVCLGTGKLDWVENIVGKNTKED